MAGGISLLTNNIKLVGVIHAAVLVFHHTGVVSLVRGDDRLHDDGPHVVTDLKVKRGKKETRTKIQVEHLLRINIRPVACCSRPRR